MVLDDRNSRPSLGSSHSSGGGRCVHVCDVSRPLPLCVGGWPIIDGQTWGTRHPPRSGGEPWRPGKRIFHSSALPRGITIMQTFSDTLGQVFRAILANKLRSFLTMFGIAWGVGSLLVLRSEEHTSE